MTATVVQMMLQCVFDGSLSMRDTDIERRPYHRNCSCALHKSKVARPTDCFQHGNVALPKKQSWSDCSISKAASKVSSQSSFICDLSGRNIEAANESLSKFDFV